MSNLFPKKIGIYLSLTVLTTLTACGGGGSGGADEGAAVEMDVTEDVGADVGVDDEVDVGMDTGMELIAELDPENTGMSCGDRSFLNDTAGLPSVYFNGFIPVTKQQAGFVTTDWVYTYDFESRTITVNRTDDFGSGSINNVYTLDELGRPISRVERIRNFAIQLDDRFDTQYTYDERGLVSSFMTNEVVDGVAVQPGSETNLTWSDVGGISLRESSSSNLSYEWDCTTLLSYTQVSNGSAPLNFTVTTVGSGQAVTVESTLDGQTSPQVVREFDANGNIVQGFGVANYEPTSEQVVNIELFENALFFGGSL